MRFAAPLWLLAVPVVLLLLTALAAAGGRIRRERLARLIRSENLRTQLVGVRDRGTGRLRVALFFLAALFAVLALASPWLPARKKKVDRLGIDLFVALDLSRSMLAEDVDPSRLQAARAGLKQLFARLSGDRVAIIAFAGEARQVAPLTFDRAALEYVVDHLDTESMGRGGTSLSAAIELAAEKASAKGLDPCVLLVVTDGEDHDGDPVLIARQTADRQNLRLFTAGVGTAAGGRIPIRREKGRQRGFVRDRSGGEVVTRLDEAFLTKLAEAGRGRYVPLGPDGAGLAGLLESDLAELGRKSRGVALADRVELFQWPLALALCALLAAIVIPERRGPSAVRAAAGALAALVLFAAPVSAGEVSRTAAKLLREDRAGEAFELLRDEVLRQPDDARLLYNYGIAAYAARNLAVARTAWKQVSEGPDRVLAGRALFELGNVEFRDGWDLGEKSDPELRIAQFERALDYYRLAAHGPARSDAAANGRTTGNGLIRLYLEVSGPRILSAGRALELPGNPGALDAVVEQLNDAIQFLDRLLAIDPGHAEGLRQLAHARELLKRALLERARAARKDLDKKMEKAAPRAPDQNPPGDDRKERDLEQETARLVQEHERVLDKYDQALAQPEPPEEAARERQEVAESAARLLEQSADRRIAQAQSAEKRAGKLDQLMRARPQLQGALAFTPENLPLKEKAAAVDGALESLIQERAEEVLAKAAHERAPARSVPALEEARTGLQTAAEIDPGDPKTADLTERVETALGRAYEARADENLARAKAPQPASVPQAIADSEQAAGDYSRARQMTPEREGEIAPKRAEALATLDSLRAELARRSADPGGDEPRPDREAKPEGGRNAEIPGDLRDVVIDTMTGKGRDRQPAALLRTKDSPVLRDW